MDASRSRILTNAGVKLRLYEEVVGNLLLSNVSIPSFHRFPRQPSSSVQTVNISGSSKSDKQQRKLLQVESIINHVNLFVKDGHVVVDFGGGTGHLSIPLAMRHPHVLVLSIDIKKESLEILHAAARDLAGSVTAPRDTSRLSVSTTDWELPKLFLRDKRVQSTAIPNLFTLHGSVQSFELPFDIGLALHLCGEGTDHALRAAARHNAAIVAVPCCVGKLSTKRRNPYVFQTTGKNVPTVSYPQSQQFYDAMNRTGNTNISEDWNALAKAADYSEIDFIRTPRNAVRRTAKALLERDRQCFLQESYSYQSVLTRMQPWEATPKNDILLAWHPDGPTPSDEDLSTMIVDDECSRDFEYARKHLFEASRRLDSDLALVEVDWSKEEEYRVERLLSRFLSDLTHAADPFAEHLEISDCRNRKMVHTVADRMGLLHWSRKKNVVVSLPIVTDRTISDFKRDGVVVLRNVMTAEEVSKLQNGIHRNLSNPSERASHVSLEGDPGDFFEDFCNWNRIPEYAQIMKDSRLPRIAAKLMESKIVRLYHDHLLVKEGGTEQETPWHQDQPYYNVSGSQNVTFWIPVDHVPKESSLQFVAGSHATGMWYIPRTFLTKEAKWFPEGSLPEIPDVDRSSTLSWALEPGDIVAFHMLTIHGSVGSELRRRALALRYVGDDVRHAPRQWKTSPEFPCGLKERLPEASPLDDPLFPIVFPKSKRQTSQ